MDFFSKSQKGKEGDTWILTHFHADHYKGLDKGWSLGTVLCSPITAQLAITKLKVRGAFCLLLLWPALI